MSRPITVTCQCLYAVTLKRKATKRRNLILYGAVCPMCGRGMDLWIKKQPGNEVHEVGRQ
jgi:hypothetical protein